MTSPLRKPCSRATPRFTKHSEPRPNSTERISISPSAPDARPCAYSREPDQPARPVFLPRDAGGVGALESRAAAPVPKLLADYLLLAISFKRSRARRSLPVRVLLIERRLAEANLNPMRMSL